MVARPHTEFTHPEAVDSVDVGDVPGVETPQICSLRLHRSSVLAVVLLRAVLTHALHSTHRTDAGSEVAFDAVTTEACAAHFAVVVSSGVLATLAGVARVREIGNCRSALELWRLLHRSTRHRRLRLRLFLLWSTHCGFLLPADVTWTQVPTDEAHPSTRRLGRGSLIPSSQTVQTEVAPALLLTAAEETGSGLLRRAAMTRRSQEQGLVVCGHYEWCICIRQKVSTSQSTVVIVSSCGFVCISLTMTRALITGKPLS